MVGEVNGGCIFGGLEGVRTGVEGVCDGLCGSGSGSAHERDCMRSQMGMGKGLHGSGNENGTSLIPTERLKFQYNKKMYYKI
jgi:hypothetical protein